MGQLLNRIAETAKAHRNSSEASSADSFSDNAAWNADQLRYAHLYASNDDDELTRAIAEAANKAAGKAHQTASPPPQATFAEPPAPSFGAASTGASNTAVLRTMNTADAAIAQALRELELPAVTSVDDIRSAYKRLILSHHPDTTAGLSAEAQFAHHDRTHRINQAFQTLRVALQF